MNLFNEFVSLWLKQTEFERYNPPIYSDSKVPGADPDLMQWVHVLPEMEFSSSLIVYDITIITIINIVVVVVIIVVVIIINNIIIVVVIFKIFFPIRPNTSRCTSIIDKKLLKNSIVTETVTLKLWIQTGICGFVPFQGSKAEITFQRSRWKE